jgi:small subunit ribosomal protein S17
MRERGLRKKLTGTVVSTRMDKTALILVERLTKHRTYKKYIRKRSKYMAHDPKNMCHVGDTVRIIESRPISKRKRWQVTGIIEKINSESESDNGRPSELTK